MVVFLINKVKKILIHILDWLLYKMLKTKQKQYVSNLFTAKQKNRVKRILNTGNKRAHIKKIEQLKYKIYNLGFFEKGLMELQSVFNDTPDPFLKRLAAWELAVWYANQYSKEGAKRCIAFLEEAAVNEKDKELLRRAAVLKAESYEILGELTRGKQVISDALVLEEHADLYLAAANLETSIEAKVDWINKAFDMYNTLNITLEQRLDSYPYDRIGTIDLKETVGPQDHKVTVIVPAYNAEDVIQTSLTSILAQSWRNIEVIVVDDCSTDHTAMVIQEYVLKDKRVKYIKTEKNSGAYVSRNLALKAATGDFVTINDADDWSHSKKIETQVLHLFRNPKVVGNFSQQARLTNEMKFYRRGKPGMYVFSNMSSLMFRREKVFNKIGYWDTVRFGGDSEFVKRLKIVFGEKSLVELKTAPLSFQRQSINSLTGHSAFGFPGYFMGARKEYAEAHDAFHKQTSNLFYDFPAKDRPFTIPEPMLPNRERDKLKVRHFDVIIASEFRLSGGTNMSNIEEIKAQKKMGLRTGLIQLSRYDLNSQGPINPKIRELLDGDQVQMLVYGENITCDILIVRHPPILQEWQKYVPNVKAKRVNVIINQPPKREYSENGITLYDFAHCKENLMEYFGSEGIWYPIGPLVRETLYKHHFNEIKNLQLEEEDWVNIINVKEWRRETISRTDNKIKIGRHSRDQYVKWPDDKKLLLSIYPDREPFEIYVLGGAESPKKLLGRLPSNWTVYNFGELHPKEFLQYLDVFVYYTHPDWVEAFGRVIFESMAAGVPVILKPSYKKLFKEAAIYAEPNEVIDKVECLMKNPDYYSQVVDTAYKYVESHFGYSKHASRLGKSLNEKRS